MRIRSLQITVLLFASILSHLPPCLAGQEDLKLWYSKPAKTWMTEALPLGNGRLGCMFFGGVPRERIQFNEDSLWTGDENPSGDYGKMGAYQAFGDVYIDFPGHTNFGAYRRELDLAQALGRIVYKSGDVTYTREYLASAPAQVMVFRFTADKPGSLTGSIELTDMHRGQISAKESSGTISCSGALPGNGLQYYSHLLVRNDGGKIRVENNRVYFDACNAITVFLNAGTDYAFTYQTKYRGEPPQKPIAEITEAAAQISFNNLKR